MTEKDAVKCGDLELADAWYVPVTAVPDEQLIADIGASLLSVSTVKRA